MSTDILFISLEGADPSLISQWCAAGELPVLSKLMRDWSILDITPPPGFGESAFWSSLYTGCNAGEHGHYFPWQLDPSSYKTDAFDNNQHLRRDPFWMYASKMGRKVGVVDLKSSPLLQGLNGVQVVDWASHDPAAKPASWPDSLINTLYDKYPFSHFKVKDEKAQTEHLSEQDRLNLHKSALERIAVKSDAVSALLSSNKWALFAVGFGEAANIGQLSWHWHDKTAPNHPSELVAEHGDPLLQTYKALDSALEKLLSSAGAKEVFLVAGMGMGMQTSCNAVIDEVLGHWSGHIGSRQKLQEQRPSRPYFALPHSMNAAAIRINLKGRERTGVIEAKHYDRVCDELELKLMSIKDADSGIAVVDHIVRTKNSYMGSNVEFLPDLLVVWQRDQRVTRVSIPDVGELSIEPMTPPEFNSGSHIPEALLMSSKQYRAAKCDQEAADAMPLEAIAPTIAQSLGLRISGLDEKPLLAGSEGAKLSVKC